MKSHSFWFSLGAQDELVEEEEEVTVVPGMGPCHECHIYNICGM